ncbi:MAG TPA: YafY family protein [Roseomonas sp.]|jgi:predicted DNA-binding transcriptional regulator YafY
MRASRLLSILTTLQARGRVTAQSLADACEVSLRTIYRDIEALSAAGIPVYSERGSEGGYRLLDGYRVRLNGLSPREAEALFLTGLSGPAADLGLGAVMAAAQTKLLAALPQDLRMGAERMRARFHLDAPAWFGEAEQPAHLPGIADAVWRQRPIRIRYRSWKAVRERRVEPLGIVLKSGAWYLAGRVEASVRTYRIARILDLVPLDGQFERPPDFDLAVYWKAATERLEAELRPDTARLRLSPWGVKMLAAFSSPYVRAGTRVEPVADAAGWRLATLPIGSLREAVVDLLRLGAEAEVIDPPALRARMAAIAAGMIALYGGPASDGYSDDVLPPEPNG